MKWLDSFVNAIFMLIRPIVDEEITKVGIIVLIILLIVPGVSLACVGAEYLIGQECCPMCGPGK